MHESSYQMIILKYFIFKLEPEFAKLNEVFNSKTDLIITKIDEESHLVSFYNQKQMKIKNNLSTTKKKRDTSIKKIWDHLRVEQAEQQSTE